MHYVLNVHMRSTSEHISSSKTQLRMKMLHFSRVLKQNKIITLPLYTSVDRRLERILIICYTNICYTYAGW